GRWTDEEIVNELKKTEIGKETLDWLIKNKDKVRVLVYEKIDDVDAKAGKRWPLYGVTQGPSDKNPWYTCSISRTLCPDLLTAAATIVHEAQHAKGYMAWYNAKTDEERAKADLEGSEFYARIHDITYYIQYHNKY